MRLFFCALFATSLMLHAQSNKRVQQGAFEVIGLAARTTNIDEMGPNGVIPRFWQRLMSQKLLDQIPNKLDTDIVAVYTEYASDENGAYTYLLGARVKDGSVAPEGMRSMHVPASSYLVFPSARGTVEKVVPAEWQIIWKAFPADAPAQRAFQADFEVYGKSAMNPKDAQIDIYIGVR